MHTRKAYETWEADQPDAREGQAGRPPFGLIEERHRKVAKIEKPSVDTLALLQVSEKRPSRVLPTMAEMTVMLLLPAVRRKKKWTVAYQSSGSVTQ
jgi:hypothetical protein